jgi:hypothetical protein
MALARAELGDAIRPRSRGRAKKVSIRGEENQNATAAE